MSRSIRIGLSIAISVVFLAFAVRGVEWDKAFAALASAHYIWVIPMLFITPYTLFIRAQRWRLLLRPLGKPAMRTLIDATNIGFMANMVLPLRVGEVIRPVLLSRKEKQPLGGILATIVLERIFDIVTILLLFGLSITAVNQLGLASAGGGASAQVTSWGSYLLTLAVILAAGVAFVRWQEKLATRILQIFLRPLPNTVSGPIDNFFRGFVQALDILDSPIAFLQLFGWSVYLWLVITSIYLVGLIAFELPVPLLAGSVVVTAIVAIAVAAPSAPGYIGAFQIGCTLSLSMFGVPESQAFAYSIVLHVAQFIGVVMAGLFSLWGGGMSLRQLEEVTEVDDAAA